ncbi:hypothetical protein AX774_g4907 [Zancudomyces culisetae]|uniref:Uncharacterized protein n=1 Tax=Zancudomyces culisetae TaxID=1213189 RepID=A0A1R1PKZ7_ZANCU|nr:hypothetical protein AX774_g4907 [Zancudomyces culisetae]|eukprot:OMH81635.1 hypothetical protein AX774_g4907 [Zancudomyces culisetae]
MDMSIPLSGRGSREELKDTNTESNSRLSTVYTFIDPRTVVNTITDRLNSLIYNDSDVKNSTENTKENPEREKEISDVMGGQLSSLSIDFDANEEDTCRYALMIACISDQMERKGKYNPILTYDSEIIAGPKDAFYNGNESSKSKDIKFRSAVDNDYTVPDDFSRKTPSGHKGFYTRSANEVDLRILEKDESKLGDKEFKTSAENLKDNDTKSFGQRTAAKDEYRTRNTRFGRFLGYALGTKYKQPDEEKTKLLYPKTPQTSNGTSFHRYVLSEDITVTHPKSILVNKSEVDGGVAQGNTDIVESTVILSKVFLEALRKRLKVESGNKMHHILTKSSYQGIYKSLNKPGYIDNLIKYGNLNSLLALTTKVVCENVSAQELAGRYAEVVGHQLVKTIELYLDVANGLKNSNTPQQDIVLELEYLLENGNERIMSVLNKGYTEISTNDIKFDAHRRSKSSATDEPGIRHYIGLIGPMFRKRNLSEWVRVAFEVSNEKHKEMLESIRVFCNDEVLREDLLKCFELIKNGENMVEAYDSFVSEEAFFTWRHYELISLSIVLNKFPQKSVAFEGKSTNPNRASVTPFTFRTRFRLIPDKRLGSYKLLYKKAFLADVYNNTSSKTGSNLSISQNAEKLLKQCAFVWRIGDGFRATCILDVVKEYWISGTLPISYLFDAFKGVERAILKVGKSNWQKAYVIYLSNTVDTIEMHALSLLEACLDDIDAASDEDLKNIRKVLTCIEQVEYERVATPVSNFGTQKDEKSRIEASRDKIEEILKPVAGRNYLEMKRKVLEDEKNLEFAYLIYMEISKNIIKAYNKLIEAFPKNSMYCNHDIAGIFLTIVVQAFYEDVMNNVFKRRDHVIETHITSMLTAHSTYMHLTYLCKYHDYEVIYEQSLNEWFDDVLDGWLSVLEKEVPGWLSNALLMDKKTDILGFSKHSSSVTDLVACFAQQMPIVEAIKWPSMSSYGRFLNRFCKIISQNFEQYSMAIEQQFYDTQKPGTNAVATVPGAMGIAHFKESSGLFNAAKLLGKTNSTDISKQYSLESNSRFISELCIKLNNIYVVYEKMNSISAQLKLPTVAVALGGDARQSLGSLRTSAARYMYSVKICTSENAYAFKTNKNSLMENTESSQPYVRLVMKYKDGRNKPREITVGHTRRARTNTGTLRWNQTFDIEPHPFYSVCVRDKETNTIKYPVEVRVCTKDKPRSLGGVEKIHGSGVFFLSSAILKSNGNVVDLNVDLAPSGSILIKIGVDFHVDDMMFYFGRMFNILDRTLTGLECRLIEESLISIRSQLFKAFVKARRKTGKIVEKTPNGSYSPFRNMSSATLSTGNTSKPGTFTSDGISNRDDNHKRNTIFGGLPLNFLKKTVGYFHREEESVGFYRISVHAWEEGLVPIIDYLNTNLRILYSFSYEEVADRIVLQLWNEMLRAFLSILLPQLRDDTLDLAKPFAEPDLCIIYDSIDYFKWFFSGGDDKNGLSMDLLENYQYRDLFYVKDIYYRSTLELINEYITVNKEFELMSIRSNSSFPSSDAKVSSTCSNSIITKKPLPTPPSENAHGGILSQTSPLSQPKTAKETFPGVSAIGIKSKDGKVTGVDVKKLSTVYNNSEADTGLTQLSKVYAFADHQVPDSELSPRNTSTSIHIRVPPTLTPDRFVVNSVVPLKDKFYVPNKSSTGKPLPNTPEKKSSQKHARIGSGAFGKLLTLESIMRSADADAQAASSDTNIGDKSSRSGHDSVFTGSPGALQKVTEDKHSLTERKPISTHIDSVNKGPNNDVSPYPTPALAKNSSQPGQNPVETAKSYILNTLNSENDAKTRPNKAITKYYKHNHSKSTFVPSQNYEQKLPIGVLNKHKSVGASNLDTHIPTATPANRYFHDQFYNDDTGNNNSYNSNSNSNGNGNGEIAYLNINENKSKNTNNIDNSRLLVPDSSFYISELQQTKDTDPTPFTKNREIIPNKADYILRLLRLRTDDDTAARFIESQLLNRTKRLKWLVKD